MESDIVVKTESDDPTKVEEFDIVSPIEIKPMEEGEIMLTSAPRAENGRLQCPYCDKSYLKESTLDLHINKHQGLIPWPPKSCKICRKSFSDEQSYNAHMRSHVMELRKCAVCGMTFETPQALKDHLGAHDALESINMKHGGKTHPFQCEICEKILKNKKSYKQHVREHFGERKHKCALCGKTFKRTNHLKDHMYYHNRDPKFKCDICGKVAPTKARLQMHTATHMAVKPHKCEHCDRTFATHRQMMEHSAVHSDVRNYHCDTCNVHYKHRRSLRNHNAVYHPKKPKEIVEVIEKIIQPNASQLDLQVLETQLVWGSADNPQVKNEPNLPVENMDTFGDALYLNGDNNNKIEHFAMDIHSIGATQENEISAFANTLPYQPTHGQDSENSDIAQNVDETSDNSSGVNVNDSDSNSVSPLPYHTRVQNNGDHGDDCAILLSIDAGDISGDFRQWHSQSSVFPSENLHFINGSQIIEIEREIKTLGSSNNNGVLEKAAVDTKMSSSRRRKASNPRPVIQISDRSLPCTYCDERFKNQAALSEHIMTHVDGKPVVESKLKWNP